MAFGDTVTITINSVAKVLKKINQDAYSSEYLLRETGKEFNLLIRHSRDKVLVNGFPQERHNVTFSEVNYPDADGLGGYRRQIGTTILSDRTDVVADFQLFGVGFAGFLTSGNIGKLLDLES